MRQKCVCEGGGEVKPAEKKSFPDAYYVKDVKPKKKKTFREGDRVQHPSRGEGVITDVDLDLVALDYDNGESFEYSFADAMAKLEIIEEAAEPAPAAKAAAPAAAKEPSEKPRNKRLEKVAEPVTSLRDSGSAPEPRRSPVPKSHREQSRPSPQEKEPAADAGEGRLQDMALPLPEAGEGEASYHKLRAAWLTGPRTRLGNQLESPDDEEWGLDELTMSEGDKPSKMLKNEVPLKSLMHVLKDVWQRQNVL